MAGFGWSGIGALLTGGSIADATTQASGGDAAVHGTRPLVADFVPVDLQTEQGRAASANLANAGSIEALLNRIVPGYSDMLKQGTSNTMSMLRGEIPEDVQGQVQRSSAFQALMSGYAGSGMSRALTARDLGRTSLDMMNLGTNSAQLWENMATKAWSPFTVTTADQANVTGANNAGQQARDQMAFNVAAAPDPAAAAKYATDSAIGQQLMSFGMGAAGGAMAGGGGARPAGGYQYQPVAPQYQYNASTGTYQMPSRSWGA